MCNSDDRARIVGFLNDDIDFAFAQKALEAAKEANFMRQNGACQRVIRTNQEVDIPPSLAVIYSRAEQPYIRLFTEDFCGRASNGRDLRCGQSRV